MDRKAWIAIIACSLLMVANWHYMQKNAEAQRVELAAKKAAEDARQAAAPDGKPAAQPAQPAAKTAAPKQLEQPAAAAFPEETHELKSGSVTFQLTNRGGGVAKAVLAGHDQIVLNAHGTEPVAAFRRDASGSDPIPYRIIAKDGKQVVFQGTTADGIEVTKTFRLTEGKPSDEHLLALSITLKNSGTAPLKCGECYLYAGAASSLRPDDFVLPAVLWNDGGNFEYFTTGSFAGGWFSDAVTEHRHDLARFRWAGVKSRFYAHLISAPKGLDKPGKTWAARFQLDHSQDEFKDAKADFAIQGAVSLQPDEVAPGASVTQEYEIYLGPREYHRLKKFDNQQWYSMDYGMFSWISRAFINLLHWLHRLTSSWGVAIILLTIIVRTLVWPIMAKSQRSMKRMGKLQPLMKEIQEKYKDDQQRQSQEMMKLYKDYGINPVGGCLPIFIQIPIFFGCLYMLQSAAELRGQSFLWVKDLTLPDTVAHLFGLAVNPLPLLMGLTGFLQMKMMPQSPGMDKMQQRIFMFMPLIFVVFVYSFASGLSLYYTVQNLFSIFQTWVTKITKGPDEGQPLQKVERLPKGPPPANPFFNPMGKKKDKDKKNRPPRLGG